MFQDFDTTASPDQGPARLAALRNQFDDLGIDGFLIPRADAHRGEYVAPRDERLSWLTGFTGSAGFCAALRNVAGVFIDGRYRTQVKSQVDLDHFTPVPWPDIQLGTWLKQQLPQGGRVGFDAWLHTAGQIAQLEKSLIDTKITLVQVDNPVDVIWADQPSPPMAAITTHPIEFAGESSKDKCARLAKSLQDASHNSTIITLPDSIMWLLNIRGADIPRNPVAHAFAILHNDASVDLFVAPGKIKDLHGHFGPDVRIHPPEAFESELRTLDASVRLDKASVPQKVADIVGAQGVWGEEICALPKARKNSSEVQGSRDAHLRDGAAVVELLAWLDGQTPGSLTEIEVVKQLESNRAQDNALRDISFETISGTGPNGAIMHYRVTHDTNATLQPGHLLVLDSGGQYLDGTTDITRTIPIGPPGAEERAAFTRVLQGMIDMSLMRWPAGLAGRDIEAIGRVPLWQAGQDFNHGLGHGVGAYLSVHEGPQRLSRLSEVPLEPGMILSNEPGYYREGAFGIRIENLIVVQEAPALAGGDPERAMLQWETLTFAPIDHRLIVTEMLTQAQRNWLNSYHTEVATKIGPLVSDAARAWLIAATAPL